MSEQCFICLSKLVSDKKNSRSNEDATITDKSRSELDLQLDVIFILKHVVELEPEQLHGFLRRFGNPVEWMELCGRCKEQVHSVREVYLKLKETGREFEKQKWDLQEKMRASEMKKSKAKGKQKRRGRKRKVDHEEEGAGSCKQDVYDCRKVICMAAVKQKGSPVDLNPFLDGDQRASELAPKSRCQPAMIDGDLIDVIDVKNEPGLHLNTEDNFPRTPSSPQEFSLDFLNEDSNHDNDDGGFGNEDDHDDDDDGSEAEAEVNVKRFNFEEVDLDEDKQSSSADGLRRSGRAGSTNKRKYSEEDGGSSSMDGQSGKDDYTERILAMASKAGLLLNTKKCHICGAVYGFGMPYNRHMLQAHGIDVREKKPTIQGKYICPEEGCNRSFAQRPHLESHRLQKHINQSKGYFCACGKRFWQQATFHRHSQKCTKIKLKCFQCDMTFTSLKTFHHHKKTAHVSKPEKPKTPGPGESEAEGGPKTSIKPKIKVTPGSLFPMCSECGKKFKNKASLAVHLYRMHKNKVEFPCEVCGRKFMLQTNLDAHLARIHGVGDFKCDEEGCSEVYTSAEHLSRHKSIWHVPGVLPSNNGRKFGRPKTSTPADLHCPICQKSYSNINLRNAHIRRIHEKEKGPAKICQFCGKSYKSDYRFKLHLSRAHDVGQFECKEKDCNEVYLEKAHLKHHMFEKHGVEPSIPLDEEEQVESERKGQKSIINVCQYCGDTYRSGHRFKLHLARVHQIGEHKCEECNEVFTGKTEHKRHMHEKHGEGSAGTDPLEQVQSESREKKKVLLFCELCGIGKADEMQLRRHKAAVHKIGDFKCTVEGCNRVFINQKGLDGHVHAGINRPPKPKRHICETCGRSFMAPLALKTHVRNVHGMEVTGNFQCGICGNYYDAVMYYRQHLLKIHNIPYEEQETPYVEPSDQDDKMEPGTSTDTKSTLTVGGHPVQDSIFQCEICNMQFTTRGWLSRHKSKAHSLASFCKICGTQWDKPWMLRRHQASVHNMGAYKCEREGCDRSFYQQRDLDAHYKYTHEGLKRPSNFPCSFCSKTFQSLGNAQKHEESLHLCKGSKEVMCEICGKGHDTYEKYRRHQQRKHGIERVKSKCNMNVNASNNDNPNPIE